MEVTPDLLLGAYAAGYFPMAPDAASDELEWFDPPMRGVIPLDRFHLPRRLRRTVLAGLASGVPEVRIDHDFAGMVAACAEPGPGRESTWISPRIAALYCALHARGHAHSVEVWADGALTGGLYGVSLGGAFFGESMVSRQRDASKIALVHLVARLRIAGFTVLDTQFGTAHLARFGCVEIPADAYRGALARAIGQPVRFPVASGAARLRDEVDRLRGGA
ncbi:leucyl/phenylalanyl-tRNA--protein transferase [Ameyamaea chiangmaiensis NBRC 103196]|uniref:Leucyl/phenylalanyl-tRNA--protein transferase n=1 Tax=Ameyamaea chiangmaiensis TaxID=442969 RepID=A0A850PBX3_9PROT|nr:leucyl/phenylalanyl-tRNA--protein transferase [Ameyamaea chiangmaiensis]MBS4074716.1 leucyl/phenylalanyl-tRNA--protein transferase [Ameyamaea chiangmaiensis]NVN42035.1 leucyl/phenylalanyl-tRNA--protein transferase [Ameyamaea chiangmaiensis]GBQ62471.1 leucyl/phenylalanyl-tRNA--protein transferase [Ameyamaea chiangmaiensis NBRC 103196]